MHENVPLATLCILCAPHSLLLSFALQAMAKQQIWVRAVGSHTSNSVMVSLKAPTGETELAGLGYGRLYSPQVGTLDPERSYAAQGIGKGATLSLIPRLIIGGMGCCPSKSEADGAQKPEAGGVQTNDFGVSSLGASEAIGGVDKAQPHRDVGSNPADGVQETAQESTVQESTANVRFPNSNQKPL